MNDRILDCTAWKEMLDREGLRTANASVGVLTKDDFAARHGILLVWRGTDDGTSVSLRAYSGTFDPDLAILLVVEPEALHELVAAGLARAPQLARSGRMHPYMLMSLDNLEDAGLSDPVEALGLVFPRH